MKPLDVDDMIDCIESTSAENVWLLIEGEPDAIERFNMRDLFFKALQQLNEHYDLPNDKWEDNHVTERKNSTICQTFRRMGKGC